MDRLTLIIISALVSIVVPLFLLWWLLKMRHRSKAELLFNSLGAYLALFAFYYVNNWAFYSYYLGIWWLMLPVLFISYKFSLSTEMPWFTNPGTKGWINIVAMVVLLLIVTPMTYTSWSAKSIPEEAVELDFPLKGWRYYIVHGGSNLILNAHMNVQDEPLYRGQTWAQDIVQMGLFGNRANGIYPKALEKYHIYNQPVYAPCDGEVIRAENNLEDQTPPEADRENLPGNFVQLQCEGNFYVILAHLKQHSVLVEAGESVISGDPLGRIGNSGNTSEPHLHIHAQADAGGEYLLNADPLAIVYKKFGFLTRNDIVRNR